MNVGVNADIPEYVVFLKGVDPIQVLGLFFKKSDAAAEIGHLPGQKHFQGLTG